jgi:hypothetical protein
MRLVLDTNVVASGLLWSGSPTQLLDAAQSGELELFTSTRLLAELAGILTRAKFAKALAATGLPREELVLGYAELATVVVVPAAIPPTIAADPSDDHVLACAVDASADFIVSGDRHLHGLGGQYKGIRIVTPAEMVRIVEAG